MTTSTIDEQLTKYLTDVHSIEQQALAQMRSAPKLAGDPEVAEAFARHLEETEGHEARVRERLEVRAASPSTVKDLVGTITGKGFVAFARSQPDTPGKLVTHAFSYEHMELAAYDLLSRVADRAGDTDTAQVARHILQQEQAMAERLSGLFDRATDAAMREVAPDDIDDQLDSYLADAHAIEAQAIRLLGRGPKLAGTAELAALYEEHLAETEQHQQMIEHRLHQRQSSPSRLKDAALSLGALNWGLFFAAQPDTPAKLAAFAYAFEHLEIGAYEQLARVAKRAGDADTAQIAQRILGEERAAAQRIHSQFELALEAALSDQGVMV